MRTGNNILSSFKPGRILLAGLLLLFGNPAHSQIVIGGDIYGGGRQGAVGTAKLAQEQMIDAAKESVDLKAGALASDNNTTNITINSGTVRTVFGGGEQGRTFGNTKVTIQGNNTQIGSQDWEGSIYGGAFGAGDGESAYVFGHSHLYINGGNIIQNVYGGGNRAELIGSTTVYLRGGTLNGAVFGGARLANIHGYSFVNIDGEHATNNLIINAVYGGNDIAGNISSQYSDSWTWTSTVNLPTELGLANTNNRFKSYNAFVFSSPEKSGINVFVGQVFGGGNGDYAYTTNGNRKDMSELWDSRTWNESTSSYTYHYHTFTVDRTPEVSKVYLELKGGTYGYVYGGGNNATVLDNVDICLNNNTAKENIFAVNPQTLRNMGLNYDESDITSYTITGQDENSLLKSNYQFDRVFGGNNKAPMNLQPAWHITKAIINNLYSGGNAGDMTFEKGLLLTLTSNDLEVNNVYGGCRRANVYPILPQGQTKVDEMTGTVEGTDITYAFPEDLSAHILITAGKINNVYGGNDISGKVRGGNGVDIRSSILGDVYGGGNGSYAYTDNEDLSTHQLYGDFYYSTEGFSSSAAALNDFRPNAEQAWISVSGTENNPTVIEGSLYCGGNSATLDISENDPNASDKLATLKIGSYVIAHNVFLGSNGENMIDPEMLALYHDGTVRVGNEEKLFNTIDMTTDFAEYIKGVSVGIRPKITFDQRYVDNSTSIGSLFFGGNLGSVTASGTFDVVIDRPVVIFEKVVAGCNDANYKNTTYGINYVGGITKAPTQQDAPKINMTLDGITIKPGQIAFDNNDKPYIDWNTQGEGSAKRLVGGNIFGGCYTSGIINGDVVINLESATYDDATLFGNSYSGVSRDDQLNDVFSDALSIFGGGYGKNTSIEGSTTINISNTGRILKVFGGGLEGPVRDNTTINLTGGNVGKIYGGGFEGLIGGHTSVYLDGGTVYSAFAGSCNADITGYAQMFVGTRNAGITTVQNSVYGGNDFGGSILGSHDFSSLVEGITTYSSNDNVNVKSASTYVEYVQGKIANSIFGGSCGAYVYTDNSPYYSHIPEAKRTDPLPHLTSAFVNFKGNNNSQNSVRQVFGAGEGAEGGDASANIQDKMQYRSYVLLNSTPDSTFKKTDIFGAGAFSGLGMQVQQSDRNNLDNYTAIVDLARGWINNAYGASYNEGVTRRTIVNVPTGSTAKMSTLFGGGYGSKLTSPCDVYESHVSWNSSDASCGYIYGGNNNMRRVLYTFVNINAEAWSSKSDGYLSTVYGAGCGSDTWAEYTEVHLNDGALVKEVYGGGYGGKVINKVSLDAWEAQTKEDNVDNVDVNHNDLYTVIGSGYVNYGLDTENESLVGANGLGEITNTNVYIHKGAVVGLRTDLRDEGVYPVQIGGGYAYAGGCGDANDVKSGSVFGTAYIGLHGGIVWKDIYAAGTYGGVYDIYNTGEFTATSYAYVQGGAVRNVYGAGWKGRVGYTELPVTVTGMTKQQIAEIVDRDIPGESHVVIGIKPELKESYIAAGRDWGFFDGEPTVERNAYSSGEDGGCVIGTAYLTMYGGYVGYRYNAIENPDNFNGFHLKTNAVDDGTYVEKTYDETWTFDKQHPNPEDGKDRLVDSGNVFGGGYTDNATADHTIVTVWGGNIRNSVYGGGEVAAIGRGEALQTEGSAIRQLKGIYQSGSTQVNIYSGHINRNVFGGGKGYNNNGTKGKLLTDGYVFGSTEVNIYGGEIGTEETVLEGDGNVFGGGNIGYVFNSRNSMRNDGNDNEEGDGYYYQIDDNGAFITNNNEKLLSEDCKVVVKPYSRVLNPNGVSVPKPDGTGDTIFSQYSYVPTEYLNKIRKGDPRWYNINKDSGDLDVTGITIRNAVFAGGNVSSGNELYANTKTVFGNATASVIDLYYCDLITIGTEHIGGLYGDGNLTRVDGYRELNITNYGTDYYGMSTNRVTLEDYHKMNDRERAYFQLKYQCLQQFTWGNKTYGPESVVTKDEMKEDLLGSYIKVGNDSIVIVSSTGVPNPDYWKEYGFVSIYAGRLINTLQRADFVGVFGSRMVMQGARDRVPETVDFTDYTINRVGEVSLNRVNKPNNDDPEEKPQNGNYFGIYNIVNYLAAITSDVDLYDEDRVTLKGSDEHYLPQNEAEEKWFGWKLANKNNRRRNDGEAENKVALASGVYLELTTEKSTAEEKDWGIITGVLELDLINVMPGLGGGYVYAKNVHGERNDLHLKHITLSPYNKNAVSNKRYEYFATNDDDDVQTSGNLVSKDKIIIDDCYPISDSYSGTNPAKGHYWYIKGEIYLYDLYLSAYTGAAEAYSRNVSIPLTITAGSHGVIQLQDVKPNKYIYYGADNETPLRAQEQIIINNVTYNLNDSISYWDWLQLSGTDQLKFVDTTYVTIAECQAGETTYAKGSVVDAKRYQQIYNSLGDDKTVHHVAKNKDVPMEEVFRMSNSMTHNKGYALTLDMNNPELWDVYYAKNAGSDKSLTQTDAYPLKAPTYKVKANHSGIYGQREYAHGDIITKDVYDTYQALATNHADLIANIEHPAVFEEAYVMKEDWSIQDDISVRYYNKGLVMAKSDWSANGIGNKAGPALFCMDTWKLSYPEMYDEYVFYGTSMTREEIEELAREYHLTDAQIEQAIKLHFAPAFYCKTAGTYGGDYYQAGNNYLTKTAWSAMNPEDRKHFEFNYDAFDILIDSTFSGNTLLYDGVDPAQPGVYSGQQPIDYTAKYTPETSTTYYKSDGTSAQLVQNQTMGRVEYESLPNEQYHYAPILVTKTDSTYHVVKTPFDVGSTSYTIGNIVTDATYRNNIPSSNYGYFDNLTFTTTGKYYYCRDSYEIGENGTEDNEPENLSVSDALGRHDDHGVGDIVEVGYVIPESKYNALPNVQKYFSIHGKTPVGVSTLYVSGQSNILDLSKGRIYTIIYQYDYEESDDEGNNINHISEKHVVNIHVMFQGGTPTIAQINTPPTILPGSTIGMSTPRVTPGAYEVIGGGWELFASQKDAENHENGAEFDNGNTVLYWFNNDYYLAYYAKTYLGKTYSNAVPIKVGNYHDLSRVMKDTLHHMYVDHLNVKRPSKIYISNDKYDAAKQADATMNELDMLKEFFDLSLYDLTYDEETHNPIAIADGSFKKHIPMNSRVKGGNNIDFILKSDVEPMKYTDWTPIGTSTQCFEGILHGDGHTISGLNNSLFGYLCGDVYNLGVTGTFTGAGIADNGSGRIENAWINTTGTVTANTTPVFGGQDGTVVNAYYPEEITAYATRDGVTARPMRAFHNGEVAYDLNGFYLAKRYAINTNDANDYKYFYTITDNNNNLLSALPDDFVEAPASDYVAQRYSNEDFIYASGSIPDQANERMFFKEPTNEQTPDPKNKHYFPIYPDDYIFFGQMLTYGYSSTTGETYQEYPSSINRADRNSVGTQHYASQWLVREEENSSSRVKSNRVYRAPAYFGNSTMSVAHFNANAFLPAKTSNGQTDVYPGMTALDLTGYGDTNWTNGWNQTTGIFMARILDYNLLTGFRSDGQTRNLLVYSKASDNSSNNILTTYMADQSWDYGNTGYKTIPVLDTEIAARVKGHLVKLDNGVYNATSDQYLVDRQDFNAPISYTFASGKSMWYQRDPELFVNSTDAGWEAISLPFTAQYVTTQDKGEITHFYSGSKTNHEYWLREYNKVNTQQDENEQSITTAIFSTPAADEGYDKIYANTFLWDYYYSWSNRNDANKDDYQEYYSQGHTHEDYPLFAAGTPYIIGFPGLRYYEFDLSGSFMAQNTESQPRRLAEQVITFVSPDGTTIAVTDQEYAEGIVTKGDYAYKPNYKTQTLAAYLLNSTGDSFEYNANAQTVPFRAYMTTAANPVQGRAGTRSDALFIGYLGDSDPLVETPVDRNLNVYAEHMNIIVENTQTEPAVVTITTTTGRLLKQFSVQPGTKVTVPVNNRGIYIVNRKKVAVTR